MRRFQSISVADVTITRLRPHHQIPPRFSLVVEVSSDFDPRRQGSPKVIAQRQKVIGLRAKLRAKFVHIAA